MATNPLGIGVSTIPVNTSPVTGIGNVVVGGGPVVTTGDATNSTGVTTSAGGSGAAPANPLATPPFNPGGTITVPTAQGYTDTSTADALSALGSLFSGAFGSGSPSGVTSGSPSVSPATTDTSAIDPITGQPYASEAIDPATGIPYVDEGQTPPATASTGSSSGLTTWLLIGIGIVGIYFAYQQLHKKRAA